MGQIKNIKLHIVTDIKMIKMKKKVSFHQDVTKDSLHRVITRSVRMREQPRVTKEALSAVNDRYDIFYPHGNIRFSTSGKVVTAEEEDRSMDDTLPLED